MAKKDFSGNIGNSIDKMFSDTIDTQNTQETTTTKKTPGRPKKETKLRGYRYNLNLDKDLKAFMQKYTWENRTSITQWINDLIRAEMETKLAEDPNYLEDWKDD